MFDLQMPRLKAQAGEIDELSHIDWVAGFSFLSHGVRVGVRVSDAQVMEKVLPHLPPGWKITKAPVERLYSLRLRSRINRKAEQLHELYADAQKLGAMARLEGLLDSFESNVQLYVADNAPHRVFVHAGVVGWKGKAIVIPGRSYSGKTTLVKALVQAGATYYSDEYAVLDEKGLVHPYARRLGIREGHKVIRTNKYRVEELGGKTGSKPLPVGLILVSKYKEGMRFRPRAISAGEGVLALLNNTVSARRQPRMVLATLKKAIGGARLMKGRRGESLEMVAALLRNWEA